jgi:putative chitinase
VRLTDDTLGEIMPRLPQAKRELYLPFINKVMEIYEIDTPLRASAFLAQIAHESGELRYMEEIWGPTEQQKKYEPPSELAQKLGNTESGDGFRYRGRGSMMITGRANYQKYGDRLGVDLVGNPDLVATPQYAFSTAVLYWKLNGLNELADIQDFTTITRKINGGVNGLAEREKYYEIAKDALSAADADDFAFSAPFSQPNENEPFDEPPVLPRGQEFIEPDSMDPTIFSETKRSAKKSNRGFGSRLRNWFR